MVWYGMVKRAGIGGDDTYMIYTGGMSFDICRVYAV